MKNRLVLLSASAGPGKTILLSEWAQQSSSLVAWLALDTDDNDPVRSWSYVVAALQQASLASVASLLQRLRSLPLASLHSLLVELINVLDAEARDIVIILDDYHLLEAPLLHDSLVFFLKNLPQHIHVVVASRSEPPFPLAQLRARGFLWEVRSADLQFTPAEATVFLCQLQQLSLKPAEVQALVERTEGWAAGLRLASLALQEHADTSCFISQFTGSHRAVLEYLLSDVLEHQPEHVRRFLAHTSVLERFTASLCDAVTGEENGRAMLAYLAQKNLFLLSLDVEGIWYRYHHLLAEALSSRLRQDQPELFCTLHRRASEWYERHNLPEEAIQYALVSTDFEHAADLPERHVEGLWQQSELTRVLRWLNLLPAPVLGERPWLLVAQARALIGSGHFEQAEQCLRDLERVGTENVAEHIQDIFKGRIAALATEFSCVRGETQKALAYSQQALTLLPEDDLVRRTSVLQAMGGAYLHAGKLKEAQQTLTETVASSLHNNDPHRALMTLHTLGQTQALLARPDLANASYLQGLQIASRYGLTQDAVMGHILVGRGHVLCEWNDLEAAEAHLLTGIKLARRGGRVIQALGGTLTLSRVKQAQGKMQEALAVSGQAQELARQTNDSFFVNFVARFPRFLAIFVPLYITGTLTDLVEAFFYTTVFTPFSLIAALIIEGLPLLLITGIIAWLIPAAEDARNEPRFGQVMGERSFFSWIWRIVVAGVPYAAIYLFFAMLVTPIEHAFYYDPAFIASLHTVVPSTATTLILEAVLEAWIPLLGQASWPVMMRVGNVLELTGDACGRAFLMALLVALPSIQTNTAARKQVTMEGVAKI